MTQAPGGPHRSSGTFRAAIRSVSASRRERVTREPLEPPASCGGADGKPAEGGSFARVSSGLSTRIVPRGRCGEPSHACRQRPWQAWVIRPDRLGDPVHPMQLEQIEVPEPGPGEVLVRVMAAGVNFNGVWAAQGLPVSIFRMHRIRFHIAGSDASGIVERGRPGRPRWKPGDEVVIHCNQTCGQCPECNGLDPMACSGRRSGRTRRAGAASRSSARCRPSSCCPSRPADLGGGGQLRPHLLHRLPHAGRPGRGQGRATTCWCGAPAAASASSPSSCARCRRQPHRGGLVRRQGGAGERAGRRRR